MGRPPVGMAKRWAGRRSEWPRDGPAAGRLRPRGRPFRAAAGQQPVGSGSVTGRRRVRNGPAAVAMGRPRVSDGPSAALAGSRSVIAGPLACAGLCWLRKVNHGEAELEPEPLAGQLAPCDQHVVTAHHSA